MEELNKIAAANIRCLRKTRGGSRERLAHEIGFKHPNSMGCIERGSYRITLDILEKIANVFQVETWTFLLREAPVLYNPAVTKQSLRQIRQATDQIADVLGVEIEDDI